MGIFQRREIEKLRNRVFLFLLPLLLFACNPPEMPLPGITGKAGELVVVMDEKEWKGLPGDTVFNTLSQHVYGLPQPEPMFNVVHIKSDAFTKIFQTHRNLLITSIGPEYKKRIELKTDVWSTPQVVIEIAAPTEEEFIELFSANASRIIGHVLKKEEARVIKSYASQLNKEAAGKIKSKFGVSLSLPYGYNIATDEDDFIWARYEDKDITQSVLIYSEPYEKENTFTKEGMVEAMDRFSKNYVPGPENGTFMSVYTDYPPLFEETSIGGRYASKLTGMWTVEGALMGGPFVSYATLNPTETRVIYLHGFVYAPGKNKRNYMRQVDAILNSASLN
ncbi:MAG: DUF4837 family protein [Flavobacteriales bacterium]|nr:DUF4837 family protein [Flavobacteriales bacterium]